MNKREAGKKANGLCFVRRKRHKVDPKEDREKLIEEWLRDHQIKRCEPAWSHYGWQS